MVKIHGTVLARACIAAASIVFLAGCSTGVDRDTMQQNINALDWDIVCTTSDCQNQLNEAFLSHRTNYNNHAGELCTMSNGADVTIAHPWAPASPGADDRNLLQKAADFLENETGTLDQLSLQRLAATMNQVHIHRETGKVLQPGQESKSAGKAYGIRDLNEYLQSTLKERYDSKYAAYQEFGDIIFWTNQDRTYRSENYAFNFSPSNPVVVTGAPDTSRYLVTTVSCENHQKNSSMFDSINSIDYTNANSCRLATREDWRLNGTKWEHYSNGAASGETLSPGEFDHNYQYDPAVGLYISNKTFKVLQSPWDSDTPISLQDGSRVMVTPGQWLVNDGTGTVEVLSDTDKQLKFELAE